MAKKRAAESEAEDPDTLPKRARVEGRNGVKGKDKEKRMKMATKSTYVEDSDDDKSVIEAEDPNETKEREDGPPRMAATQTDEEFERIHKDSVYALLRENEHKQRHSGAAEAGVISSVELRNFMCHAFLTFKLGPQINFIVGHNGSGKSAALSAITIALGGKATSTGRGAGIKSFIKSGEQAAEVSVTLKNGGHEPFRPDIYGESITVVRYFTQTGNTSYKIKSKEGKTVSTTREELSAILDHFSIDVDNPMNILTQDLARQFLSASNSSEKYNLFLKGTLLTQLQEEYDQILENTNKTKAVIAQKSMVIKELEENLAEINARHAKAKNLQEAEAAIDTLKAELAWAHIAEKEAEVLKADSKVQESKEREVMIVEKLEEAMRILRESEEKVGAVETRVNQAARPQELQAQLDALQDKVNMETIELRKAKKDVNEIVGKIKDERKNLEETEAELRTAHEQLALDAQREAIRRRIEAATINLQQAARVHKDSTVELGRKEEAVNAYRARLSQIERRYSNMREMLIAAETRVNELRKHVEGKGGLSLYGPWMSRVLGIIGNTRWTGSKPLGPLGQHVKLKDTKWASVLRIGIGNLLGGFAVTNSADFKTLRGILDSNGANRTPIVVAEPDIFDYGAGEPPAHVLTVLRALEIDNEWVTRILINSFKIERIILASDRKEAERILDMVPRSIVWTAEQNLRVQRYSDGGGQTAPLGRINNPRDFRHLLFTDQSGQAELQQAEAEKRRQEADYKTVEDEKHDSMRTLREKENELQAAKHTAKQAEVAARRANVELENAKAEDLQEKPLDLEVLERTATDLRERIEDLERQLSAGSAHFQRLAEDIKPKVQQTAAVRQQLKEYDNRKAELKLELDEAAGEHANAGKDVAYYKRKLATQREEVQSREVIQRTLEEEYTSWRAQVELKYDEVRNPRPAKTVDKALKAKELSHEKSLREQGQSIEEIVADLERAQLAYNKAKKEFRDMNHLVALLRRSLSMRMQKWQHFRQFITLRTKLQFQFYLSQRGFYGQVIVNHGAGTLDLRVRTDEQENQTDRSREKDAKMSGGEKSFATICLLLSLWDAMGCPIRALDEFDVYMDAVNRRISMKMMLDAAKNSDKQHILITPQDMGNVQIGPEVRIHRMHDPERGQQTLRFN